MISTAFNSLTDFLMFTIDLYLEDGLNLPYALIGAP